MFSLSYSVILAMHKEIICVLSDPKMTGNPEVLDDAGLDQNLNAARTFNDKTMHQLNRKVGQPTTVLQMKVFCKAASLPDQSVPAEVIKWQQ